MRKSNEPKLTAAVLIAYVRKPPNVSQVHRETNHRQKEIHLFAPFVPGVRLRNDRHRGRAVGAVVGWTAGHDCGVLSGHRTVKSHAEDQRCCVSCGDDRRGVGGAAPGTGGHLLAEALYAQAVPTVRSSNERNRVSCSAILLLNRTNTFQEVKVLL